MIFNKYLYGSANYTIALLVFPNTHPVVVVKHISIGRPGKKKFESIHLTGGLLKVCHL